MLRYYRIVETISTYHQRHEADPEGPDRQYETSYYGPDLAYGGLEYTPFIVGLGIEMRHGTFTRLALDGGRLSAFSSGFVRYHWFGTHRYIGSSVNDVYVSGVPTATGFPRWQTALIGIGLRASPGEVSRMDVQLAGQAFTDSNDDQPDWNRVWYPEHTFNEDYEQITSMPDGWVCRGLIIHTGSGEVLKNYRLDWGRFEVGLAVDAIVVVKQVDDHGRLLVENIPFGGSPASHRWYLDPKSREFAQLKQRIDSARKNATPVTVRGVRWESEDDVELRMILDR